MQPKISLCPKKYFMIKSVLGVSAKSQMELFQALYGYRNMLHAELANNNIDHLLNIIPVFGSEYLDGLVDDADGQNLLLKICTMKPNQQLVRLCALLLDRNVSVLAVDKKCNNMFHLVCATQNDALFQVRL